MTKDQSVGSFEKVPTNRSHTTIDVKSSNPSNELSARLNKACEGEFGGLDAWRLLLDCKTEIYRLRAALVQLRNELPEASQIIDAVLDGMTLHADTSGESHDD